jgi:HKD family nuclease
LPISFLDNNFGFTFFSLLDKTEKQIHIISPYIGFNTATSLSQMIEESSKDIKCTLITKFNREDFLTKASSITGLELLANAGIKIYALQNLHSKLYIFDEKTVITGSANFTFNGFYRNHEFGILMENESIFSQECNHYFQQLLQDIKKSGDFEVDLERINKEKKICDNIVTDRANSQKKPGKNSSPITTLPNPFKWGADINFDRSPDSLPGSPDLLENALNEVQDNNNTNKNTGIWLKFEGNSDDRIPNDVTFFERRKKQHFTQTFFPRPPKSIKEGQFMFMTMVSRDEDGEGTPIIVGYTKTQGYSVNNVINSDVPFNDKNIGRYPYFVELFEGRFLKAPIKYGISLRELARELGSDLYPSHKSNFHEIIYTHRQKSHIQITPKAQSYIVKRLEDLFSKYGVDEI